jgi:hypothetical protein
MLDSEKRKRWFIVAAIALANPTAQAQQATLTLACNGTASSVGEEKPEPISTGVILNFNTRTVQGFNAPEDGMVMIDGHNDAIIPFHGWRRRGNEKQFVSGSIDRVTGDLKAEFKIYSDDGPPARDVATTTYTLKCRSAQRLL